MSDAALTLTEPPPGPPPLPLIANLHQWSRGPLDFLLEIRRTYGPQARFRIAGYDFWLLTDPADIETVLLTEHRKIKKDHIYEKIAELAGHGLVTSDGDLWRRHRKIVSKPFAAKHVDGYAGQIREIAERYVTEGERDLSTDMNHFTEAVVLEVLFGLPPSEGGQVGSAIETWMRQFHSEDSGLLRLVPAWVPTPGRLRARAAVEALDGFIYEVIDQKKQAGATGTDALSRLITAAEEEGGMTDEELRDEAVTLFVAGHETTALALTYTLRQLALHPAWQDRVREEIRTVLPDGAHTAEDVAKLEVTHAVLQEAMRIHPPVWAIGREAMEDIAIGGRHCPAGTQLIISQWVNNRDSEYFPDPERYDPQRWLDGLEERLPRWVWLPFGGGPRVCIGNRFAMLEAVVLLATVLRDRRVEPVDAMDVELLNSVTLRTVNPLRARFSPVS